MFYKSALNGCLLKNNPSCDYWLYVLTTIYYFTELVGELLETENFTFVLHVHSYI
jgi:hypothetical protein